MLSIRKVRNYSPQSIQVNIQIMRIYVRIREMLLAHKDVFLQVEQVKKQLMKHDQKIDLLFISVSSLKRKISPELTSVLSKKEHKNTPKKQVTF